MNDNSNASTPGPWVEVWEGSTEEQRGGWFVVGSNGKAVMSACVTLTEGRFTLPSAADRALILAAPSQQAKIDMLLDACKAAWAILDAMVGYDIKYLNTNEGAIFDIPKTCAQVKAAIAKAEGGKP